MASKKKAPAKKKGPDLSSRPLTYGDLSRQEQKDTEALMSGVSETMPTQFERLAHTLRKATHPTQVSARKRYEKAAPLAESKPMSLESMTQNRVDSFMRALTGPHRLPHEAYTGDEFYFEHRGMVDEAHAQVNAPHIPIENALASAARLSVRTKPEQEKQSVHGLLSAHAHGSVDFNPEMVAGLSKHGVKVPAELHGKTIPFAETPAHIVSSFHKPAIRAVAQPHVQNANLDAISKTGTAKNLEEGHRAMQGQNFPSPTKNPKQWAYQKAHERAIPDSPEHGEYQMRKMHLGRVARGEESSNQMMFDFYGLRDSNEGVLSNQMAMPEDSWMNAISYDQPAKIKKAAGDVNLSTKTGTTKRGRKLSVGEGIGAIEPASIQHALNTEATSRAAKQVQETLGIDFTVPAMMVQEGTWAETRRDLGKDSEYNAIRRGEQPKTPKTKKQPTLFD